MKKIIKEIIKTIKEQYIFFLCILLFVGVYPWLLKYLDF